MVDVSSLRGVRGATIGAAVTAVGIQAVVMVSGVLAARMLGPVDRGHLALFALVPAILSQLGNLGLPLAVTYEVARDPRGQRALAGSLWKAVIAQALVLGTLHLLALFLLFRGDPAYVRDAALVSAVLIPVQLLQTYGLAFLQGQGRYRWFNVLRLVPWTLYAAFLVGVLVASESRLIVVTAVWVVAVTAAALVTTLVAWHGVSKSPADPEATPNVGGMLRFGARAVLGSVSPVDQYRLDQAVVGLFFAPVALGYYVVAVAFSNLPRLIAQSVGMIAYPHVARLRDAARARGTILRFLWVTLAGCGLVIGALELTIGWLVPTFFGSEFDAAVPFARWLLLGTLLFCARRVLTDGLRGAGHPGVGSVAELVSWIALIPLVPLLVAPLGVEGVAVAMVGSSAAGLVVAVGGVLRLPAATRRDEPTERVVLEPL